MTTELWRSTREFPPGNDDVDIHGDVLMKLPNGNAARCKLIVAQEVDDGLWMRTAEWVDEAPEAMDKEATDAKVMEIQMAMGNVITGLKELGVALGWRGKP